MGFFFSLLKAWLDGMFDYWQIKLVYINWNFVIKEIYLPVSEKTF